MKYVYHIYAMRQAKSGETHHVDALLRMDAPILTGEDYQKMKSMVAENIGCLDSSMFTVANLSFLHTAED